MPKKKAIDDAAVLEKALSVISEKGPELFTLADVGAAVGLSPATLLQRFKSKQRLLTLAAKQAPMTLEEDIKKLRKQKLSWDLELLELLGSLPAGFGTREDIANSLRLLRLDMIDPELHQAARELFIKLRLRMKEILLKAQNGDQLNGDAEKIAFELDALRHGLVIQWAVSGDGPLQEWLKNGIIHYIKGIKK